LRSSSLMLSHRWPTEFFLQIEQKVAQLLGARSLIAFNALPFSHNHE
jgi:hypothetical protein